MKTVWESWNVMVCLAAALALFLHWILLAARTDRGGAELHARQHLLGLSLTLHIGIVAVIAWGVPDLVGLTGKELLIALLAAASWLCVAWGYTQEVGAP